MGTAITAAKSRPLICANWKAKLGRREAEALAQAYLELLVPLKERAEIVVFPSTLHIELASRAFQGSVIAVGSQNMHWEDNGAYTGEICAGQLADYDVRYVLLGHSERREFFNESYELVNKKLQFALKKGLTPIVCVGESKEERAAGLTEMVIVDQLESALSDQSAHDLAGMALTYEPIWAIGSGQPVPIDEAAHVIEILRKMVARHFDGKPPAGLRVLYGGSVEAGQAERYASHPLIDGLLVGRASLDAKRFAALVGHLGESAISA